ncbi:MAG: hypothetical protein MJK04_18170 [Psychrosphaera sp.]|nr:hypothetical protein [Psychrosphaera sp.]
MKFGTLLVIIVSVLIAGILAGLFLKYVTAWLLHGYRRLFLKPKLLKLYQPSALEFDAKVLEKEQQEAPEKQTSVDQTHQ